MRLRNAGHAVAERVPGRRRPCNKCPSMSRAVVAFAVLSFVAGAACAAYPPTPATSGAAAVASSPGAPASSEQGVSPPSSAVPSAAAAVPAAASVAGPIAPAPSASASASVPSAPPVEPPPPENASSSSACNDQAPQDFLIRGHFLKEHDGNERAIQYRTEQYGYFKGFGRPAPGAEPPSAEVVPTTFMGLPVRMHRRVVPALACVEKEIALSCADHPYTPHALAGIRFRNTYRGGEVTNHAYGIAIDIDPAINTCCGCVPPWNDAPACKRPGKSEYDHMAMPECWVHAFERFGFYWLGHDVLKDTMHFEFLGDPDKILKGSPPAAAPVAGPSR
jgi:hypothetical protein